MSIQHDVVPNVKGGFDRNWLLKTRNNLASYHCWAAALDQQSTGDAGSKERSSVDDSPQHIYCRVVALYFSINSVLGSREEEAVLPGPPLEMILFPHWLALLSHMMTSAGYNDVIMQEWGLKEQQSSVWGILQGCRSVWWFGQMSQNLLKREEALWLLDEDWSMWVWSCDVIFLFCV